MNKTMHKLAMIAAIVAFCVKVYGLPVYVNADGGAMLMVIFIAAFVLPKALLAVMV